jgi:hypothetical protein
MSIQFYCELTDPHTEALLLFLEDLLGDNEVHKLEVLSCARQWLEMEYKKPSAFNRGDAHEKFSLRVEADQTALVSS